MKDDKGQMMLLAAVLLIMGFIALAGLVSVAQRLGEETLQEQGRSVMLEVPALEDAVQLLMEKHNVTATPGPEWDALNRSLDYLRAIEQSHGFYFDSETTTNCAPAVPVCVKIVLADAHTGVRIEVAR